MDEKYNQETMLNKRMCWKKDLQEDNRIINGKTLNNEKSD